MQCPRCRHGFTWIERLAVWFPSRVPCPSCRGELSLGTLGWLVYLAINLGGIALVLGVVAAAMLGAFPVAKALLGALLLACVAPLIWVLLIGALSPRARVGPAASRLH